MRDKKYLRLKRHRRIKLRIQGTKEQPRLVLHRSLNNLYAQVIDDTSGKSIFSLSTQNKKVRESCPSAGNIKSAVAFGEIFAKEAAAKGVNKIIFDRAGFLYHGRVKSFAEALRKGGLKF